jgi:hypothetical protein
MRLSFLNKSLRNWTEGQLGRFPILNCVVSVHFFPSMQSFSGRYYEPEVFRRSRDWPQPEQGTYHSNGAAGLNLVCLHCAS